MASISMGGTRMFLSIFFSEFFFTSLLSISKIYIFLSQVERSQDTVGIEDQRTRRKTWVSGVG